MVFTYADPGRRGDSDSYQQLELFAVWEEIEFEKVF